MQVPVGGAAALRAAVRARAGERPGPSQQLGGPAKIWGPNQILSWLGPQNLGPAKILYRVSEAKVASSLVPIRNAARFLAQWQSSVKSVCILMLLGLRSAHCRLVLVWGYLQ